MHSRGEAPNDSLYTLDAGCVKWLAGVDIISFQLGFGSVGDGPMFVRQVLRFGGVWVPKSDSDFIDVTVHCETTGALVVIPFKINTCKLCSFPISSNFVALLKGSEEVLSMLVACVLNPKVVNNQDKDYWLPFVPLCLHSPRVVAHW